MNLTPLGIDGAWMAKAEVHSDLRGTFREWFKFDEIREITGIDFAVKQANLSISNAGVIRGIHYSLSSEGQAKWITCPSGHVVDVIVDIRPESKTFKKVIQTDLRGGEASAILIGSGLGHGFLALENNSILTYLLSSPYSPKDELAVNPFDAELKIDWHSNLLDRGNHVMSTKDKEAPSLSQLLIAGKLPG
jgi:dTDP-4-dehydrorhamnose 3,5-epimerase